jgi:hypothetical protein
VIDRFTCELLREHLGSTFHLDLGEGAGIDLVLAEVADLSDREWKRSAGARRPFSLHFRGPRGQPVPQRTYPFQHAALGSFDLFIVPVGSDAEGIKYEAAFG